MQKESIQLTNRAAYSAAEFAASCGKHPTWAYRALYSGKVKAITDMGRLLIPKSELERVLALAVPYNPKSKSPKVKDKGPSNEANAL